MTQKVFKTKKTITLGASTTESSDPIYFVLTGAVRSVVLYVGGTLGEDAQLTFGVGPVIDDYTPVGYVAAGMASGPVSVCGVVRNFGADAGNIRYRETVPTWTRVMKGDRWECSIKSTSSHGSQSVSLHVEIEMVEDVYDAYVMPISVIDNFQGAGLDSGTIFSLTPPCKSRIFGRALYNTYAVDGTLEIEVRKNFARELNYTLSDDEWFPATFSEALSLSDDNDWTFYSEMFEDTFDESDKLSVDRAGESGVNFYGGWQFWIVPTGRSNVRETVQKDGTESLVHAMNMPMNCTDVIFQMASGTNASFLFKRTYLSDNEVASPLGNLIDDNDPAVNDGFQDFHFMMSNGGLTRKRYSGRMMLGCGTCFASDDSDGIGVIEFWGFVFGSKFVPRLDPNLEIENPVGEA